MDNILAFLTKLKIKQLAISLDDSNENLRIRGDLNNLSTLDKQIIVENKASLIAFLKSQIVDVFEIEQVNEQFNYAISNAQKRLWILSQIEDSSVAYNMSRQVHLNQDIDIECFKKAINSPSFPSRSISMRYETCFAKVSKSLHFISAINGIVVVIL